MFWTILAIYCLICYIIAFFLIRSEPTPGLEIESGFCFLFSPIIVPVVAFGSIVIFFAIVFCWFVGELILLGKKI